VRGVGGACTSLSLRQSLVGLIGERLPHYEAKQVPSPESIAAAI
jgi:hypothetical protein